MRIYELAKKYDVSSKNIKDILDKLKITYKTHSSSIPEEKLKEVEKQIGSSTKNPQTKKVEKTPSTTKKVKAVKKDTASAKKTTKKDKEKKDEEIAALKQPLESPEPISHVPDGIDMDEAMEKKYAKPEKIAAKKKAKPIENQQTEEKPIIIDGPIEVVNGTTVKELAEISGIPATDIIKKLFLLGMVASINQRLDKDTLHIVGDELNIEMIIKDEIIEPENITLEEEEPEVVPQFLESRPPVVTIMGHVNHGKTTLLDTIRKTKVVTSESGGITQHIGAYLVEHHGSKICFIDTPGHAAFTKMRAMGANVTDIVILIVAANDGIQPQTLESISHAKEAEVPIIIAINKTDIDGISLDQIKGDLSNVELTPEDWGGDNLCVNISALKGDGIEDLLDAINLQAELLELKANPKGNAFGIVLESCQTEKQGPLVTVLVKNGSFKIGDSILCGHVYGKIRRLENDRGESITIAGPSLPVRIFGFSEVPEISSRVKVYENDKEARDAAKAKAQTRRDHMLNVKESITIDNIYSTIQANTKKELKIILKADVVGSIGALKSLFAGITSEKVDLKVIHAATGAVTDTDVMFAHAYNAHIFTFGVKTTPSAQILAKQHKISIREYNVIYHVYDDVHKAMEGLLDLEFIEKSIGTAEVKKTFKVGKTMMIAGCLVTEGKVTKDSICKVQNKEVTSKIKSLKHYKDEVKEMRMGTECGIALEEYNDFEEGDILEFYLVEQTISKL